MSEFTVVKIQDEPIIVVTIIEHLDVEMAKAICAGIAEIAITMGCPIYCITDVRQEHTTFGKFLGVIEEASKSVSSSTMDSHIQDVFVGNENMIRAACNILRTDIGDIRKPMFATMETAFRHIRNELTQGTGT